MSNPAPMIGKDPTREACDELYASTRCRVERWRYRLPTGAAAERPVVISPGAVAIVAQTAPERVMLVRQYRYALEAWTLEVPAGTRGPDEPVLSCARRELEEEAGLRADSFRELLRYHAAPGLTDEELVVVRAIDPVPVPPRPESDELLDQVEIPIVELPGLLADGSLTDAKTLLALAAAGLLDLGARAC